MIHKFKFWCHPSIGGTGIQSLIETYYNIDFEEYDLSKVDNSKKNVLLFFWETSVSINLEQRTNTQSFFNLLKELNELGFYFLADYTTESNYGIDGDRIEFLNKLSTHIDINKFYLVTNNSDVRKIEYGPHLINHLYFPHFLLSTPLKMNEYIGDLTHYESIESTKDFLCLNRRVQEHKFYFVNKLSERGLLPYTNLSLVANKINPEIMKNSSLVNELNIDVDNFESIQLEDDVMYGNELDRADQHLYRINPKWYFDSKVNIIVETNHGDSPTHLTEKTFKAIYLKRPFVIYSTKMHLNRLQELGFTTFTDLIGEYDCTDIDSVIDAGIRLSFIYKHRDIVSSCEWNRENLLNRSRLQNIISDYFLKKIW
jgi:hypothetical protein